MIHPARNLLHGLPAAMAIIGIALVAGCGTTSEMATGKITAADKAVSVASEERNTATDAPAALKMAQDKLASAKAAQINQDYAEAARLADEASADADYARARATTAHTQRMVREVQDNISMLRKEIESTP